MLDSGSRRTGIHPLRINITQIFTSSSSLAQVCYKLKQQLAGLMMLRETMKADGWPELLIGQPVIDVRVSQWLLNPESTAVKDNPEVEEKFRKVRCFRAGTSSKIVNLDAKFPPSCATPACIGT